jgi:hypothetical protein
MISLKLLLEDIKAFRTSLDDERFDPFTAAEWKKAVEMMRDPNVQVIVKKMKLNKLLY